MSVSVVIPVLDGARYLREVLDAVLVENPDELLVIDSGSRDGSVAIARAAGAEVLEIAPNQFGHGRTRNLGASRTSGDLICFLTQDATPAPGWLAAMRSSFTLAPRVGAAYGPHLPRPDTPPMIARELSEFFAGFGTTATVQDAEPFLSNVNACYLRECWEEIRFEEIAYAEDQAFGRALLAAGWLKVYNPQAAVLHAHDYGLIGFMRRYFDEYRGLRESAGHIEPVRGLRAIRGLVGADRRWMSRRGLPIRRRTYWTARSLVHHGGRKAAAVLGSRSQRLPAAAQRAISLEGRIDSTAADRDAFAAAAAGASVDPAVREPAVALREPEFHPASGAAIWGPIGDLNRYGAAPLLDPVDGMEDAKSLHIAVVIPPFTEGSGGHSTIFNLMSRLEDRGHTVTVWLHDTAGRMRRFRPAEIRADMRRFFRPIRGPIFKDFSKWYGADVVVATGWDTVFPIMRLPNCRARVYLVQDHEPDFYATSAERMFARATYDQDLFCITAGPWLAELMRERYRAHAVHFDLGVDHDTYRRLPLERRDDTVIFYGRHTTPRRGVPLGILALTDVVARRPGTRVIVFGDKAIDLPFDREHLGVATPAELARAYAQATVGLSLSLTNYSLIPQEMMACGLPVLELDGENITAVFGKDGPIATVPADPIAISDALIALLDDPDRRARYAQAGSEFIVDKTWDHATDQVERGLRSALRMRASAPAGTQRASDPEFDGGLARRLSAEVGESVPATDILFGRLAAEDVAAVVDLLEGDHRILWDGAGKQEQRRLVISYGVWHEVPEVLAKTGLSPAAPPEEVHAMARGPLTAGGALYYGDLIGNSLKRVGADVSKLRSGLDFGCSSGRVVRMLHAVWPQVSWHGCDPNETAIEWAKANLPGIDFLGSPQDPPLSYADANFDLVVAISIWSHFGEYAALTWLGEMHRIIEPGGRLLLTSHGLQSIEYYLQTDQRSPEQLTRIRSALFQHGYWYAEEFGKRGDWGVLHPEWGTAFFTSEWLAAHTTPQWAIEDFQIGRNAGNQDVYVLRRTSD